MSSYLKKKFVVIIGAGIVCLAVIFGLVIPTLRDIQGLNRRILNERAELEERYNHRINSKIAIQNLRELKNELPTIVDKILSKRGEEIKLVTALENLASSYNLEQTLRIEPSLESSIRRGTSFAKIPMIITLTGNFTDFIKYLSRIENEYLMLSPQVITANTTEKDGSSKIEIRIQMLSFWR